MSNKHWKERLEAEIRAKQARSRTLRQEMEELYLHHYKAIESEIEGFLYRYAEREKIDRVRAQQLVDEFDVKAFEATAKKYVAEKNFSSRANSELRLYNLKMRMKAHELLQYRLDLELVALSEGERQLTEKFLTEAFVREMEEQAGLLGQSVLSREQLERLAQSRIHLEFHGAEWSESIWKRQRALRVILQEDMEKMVLKGLHPTAVVPRLRKEFGVSASQAKRLAVTEMARMSSEAQRLSFEEYGYEWYEFIAEPSACERCKELDGKKIRVREMEIGVNASPIHPNCHCTMGAYYEKAEETGQKQIIGERQKTLTYAGPYRSVKDEWLANADHSKAKLTDRRSWELEGKNYQVDGHKVVLDYKPIEKETAQWLSQVLGKHVEMVPRFNEPEGVSTPDYLIDGVPFDRKGIKGSGKYVIDGNLKKAKKQAENIVLDFSHSRLTDEEILKQMNDIYRSARRGLDITILKRDETLIDIIKKKD